MLSLGTNLNMALQDENFDFIDQFIWKLVELHCRIKQLDREASTIGLFRKQTVRFLI
jgi:hypothetical protein